MLIESNISEILLNMFPVSSIAPDKRIFPTPVLFIMGCNHHVCICLVWHFTLTRRIPQVLTGKNFCFLLTSKKITEQQQQA